MRLHYGNYISIFSFQSQEKHALIRVYGETGNVIETHEHADDFKEW